MTKWIKCADREPPILTLLEFKSEKLGIIKGFYSVRMFDNKGGYFHDGGTCFDVTEWRHIRKFKITWFYEFLYAYIFCGLPNLIFGFKMGILFFVAYIAGLSASTVMKKIKVFFNEDN